MCSKAIIKYPTILQMRRYTTSVLINGHAPEMNGANWHAKLSHSKQLLKNIQPILLAQFCIVNEQVNAKRVFQKVS